MPIISRDEKIPKIKFNVYKSNKNFERKIKI